MVLAVPLIVIAVLVKLTSRGPALYHQQRIGLGGRPFEIYKFRTMNVDAETKTGPVWRGAAIHAARSLATCSDARAWTNCRSFSMSCGEI